MQHRDTFGIEILLCSEINVWYYYCNDNSGKHVSNVTNSTRTTMTTSTAVNDYYYCTNMSRTENFNF